MGKDNSKKRAFTLIELLVVIAIIGLLSTISVIALNGARMKARDAKRKADLRQIKNALELYYDEHGLYPQAGSCDYGTNCYVFSTAGDDWLSDLSPYMPKQPVDPKNNAGTPWNDGHYSYGYGNVTANGQDFDLFTQLENHEDPDRCEIKQYTFYFDNRLWCGSYSDYIYAIQ